MATNLKGNISKTEHFFRIFYYVPEIYVKFGVFSEKKIRLIAEVLQKLLTAKQVAT